MQRLRTTFKRSRTPTGAEMKTQSSLEVPKQVRSASFDEIQLEATRMQQASLSPRPEDPGGAAGGGYLIVPTTSQRSKSFDSGGAQQPEEGGMFLEVPNKKLQRRKSSGDKSPPYCVHCALLEDFNRFRFSSEESSSGMRTSNSDTSTSEEEEWDSDPDDTSLVSSKCCITVTFSPNSPSTPSLETPQAEEELSPSGRRRSITSAKLERQQAFMFNETSVDTVLLVPPLEPPPLPPPRPPQENVIVNQFFLTVPELKRDRAASVDSCFLNKSTSGKAEEVIPETALLEPPPLGPAALRSRSVDIVLPTDQQARYKALSMNSAPSTSRGGSTEGDEASSSSSAGRSSTTIRVTPDWGEHAIEGEHLWVPTSPSSDFCYCGEFECLISKSSRHGARLKCSACKILCHTNCLTALERLKFYCKPTFRDVGVRSYREQTSTKHHWVHRRQQKGKCKACFKSFHSKLSFSNKDIVALSCSWCKESYHNKESCFTSDRIDEDCSLGTHQPIIVPPAWIVKLPRKGSFKSSLRKSPKKKSSKRNSKEKNDPEVAPQSPPDPPSHPSDKEDPEKTFTLKPIPSTSLRPVIVFINPKSGGNQGVKLLQKFQWLLNPRQVFDLTQGGPRMGLELFRKVPNLRILACGGDGTAGWVLSVIDQLGFSPPPAVGVLPLGTGNDLARALGWGGGYTDEPISKILCNIGESDVVFLDRWELKVEHNSNASSSESAKDNLPLNVVNNYFSLGVDAHIALEFHEAREAHPERFNSRLKNKMFYGQMGGKDLLRRKWKDLAEFVTLECDGKDYTGKLKENKFHAIVFLNIPSYGGGTHPWPKVSGMEPATDDGLIEVVGLSTYQLPFLQAGGHGTSICQCKTATVTTMKPIPMQVDGEACKLNPSIIHLSLLNKAPMLSKRKGGKTATHQALLEPVRISIHKISMLDYEKHHYDKSLLKASAVNIGEIEVSPIADLEQVRQKVVAQREAASDDKGLALGADWCFVDTCTAERFFRVDRAQEHLHYLTDIASDALYVLDPMVQTPEEETIFPSPASANSSHQSSSGLTSEPNPEFSPSDEASLGVRLGAARLDEAGGGINVNRYNLEVKEDPSLKSGYISSLLEKTTDGVVKAAMEGDIKKLKELHGHGYSLLSIDSTGQTALHYSAQYGYQDIVKYLIASAPHSILNMADNEKGQTALHKAARNKHRSICCMLVAGGASLSSTDNFGNTPKLLALEAKDQPLASYLESQEHFQLLAEEQEAAF